MSKSTIAEMWLALCGTLFLVAVCVFIALERYGWLDTIRFTIDGWTYAWGGMMKLDRSGRNPKYIIESREDGLECVRKVRAHLDPWAGWSVECGAALNALYDYFGHGEDDKGG